MPASPSISTILRAPFAAPFQAFTSAFHSSFAADEAGLEGGSAGVPLVAARAGAQPARRRSRSAGPGRSRRWEGSQPVSRSSAVRYSASLASAAPGRPRDTWPRWPPGPPPRTGGRTPATGRRAPPPPASAAGPSRPGPACRGRRRIAEAGLDRVSATQSSNWGAWRMENPARNRGMSMATAASGSRLRLSEELDHIAAHRLGELDQPAGRSGPPRRASHGAASAPGAGRRAPPPPATRPRRGRRALRGCGDGARA